MAATTVFISHISEEGAVASKLKAIISRDFLDLIDVFVSSDGESISAGDSWLESVERELRQASVLITLCSPASRARPWLYFEAGAAWMLKKPIIPLCHAGLKITDLPLPLSLSQGIALESPEGIRALYRRLAQLLSCACPERDFDDLARSLAEVEATVSRPVVPSPLERDRAVQKRLMESLSASRLPWRTLDRLATEAAVDPEVAADLLRADDAVRFSRGRSNKLIVGLRSRVDPAG
jgi:hypothetical protein